MQSEYSESLNNLLVDGFRMVLKIEEKMIRSAHGIDLTINELHTLETIGKSEDGANITEISKALGITMPSVSVAVRKLEAKGYLTKEKKLNDGRQISLHLTEQGARINRIHLYFHERMVRSIIENLNEEDKKVFFDSIYRLDHFFKQQVEKMDDENNM